MYLLEDRQDKGTMDDERKLRHWLRKREAWVSYDRVFLEKNGRLMSKVLEIRQTKRSI